MSTNRRDEPSTQTPQPLSASLKSPYAGAIAATILILFTVLTLGDYQFKAIARSTYPSRDELASFMGTFYGASSMKRTSRTQCKMSSLSRVGSLRKNAFGEGIP